MNNSIIMIGSIAITVLAYILLLGLPVMVQPHPLQLFFSASCSTLAVVTLFRFVRTGPIWVRIVIGLVILPLLAHIVMVIASAWV